MVSRVVKIINPSGLVLRPAGAFCEKAMQYQSKIIFHVHENYEANAKSVLSVLGACVKTGEEIELICEGSDEVQALEEICTFLEEGIGE